MLEIDGIKFKDDYSPLFYVYHILFLEENISTTKFPIQNIYDDHEKNVLYEIENMVATMVASKFEHPYLTKFITKYPNVLNEIVKPNNKKYKIKTERGFETFSGIKRMKSDIGLKLTFEDESVLKCTFGHLLKLSNGFMEACDVRSGDVISNKIVRDIEEIRETLYYYDVLGVQGEDYIANGVTNHNCAFLENWDEFYSSVYPTVASGNKTKVLFSSTPYGLNHFHKICEEAKELSEESIAEGSNIGKNGFIYIEVKWDRVPGRDEKWKKETLAGIGNNLEQFEQEFNVSFVGSSDTLISSQGLSNLVAKNPIDKTAHMFQYRKPAKDRTYCLIADVSKGKGLDYSAFSVIDVSEMPYYQVCVYRNNTIGPLDYAAVIHSVAKLYNDAMVMIEVNNIGSQVSDCLWMDFGYENMLSTETKGRSGKKVSSGFGKNMDRGITTTEKVKLVGCSILKMLVEQQQLILNDFNTIEELKRFSKKANSYEAIKGHNDDIVMGLVLFSWLSDQGYFKELTEINTLNNLRETTDEEVNEYMLGFVITSDDSTDGYWQPV